METMNPSNRKLFIVDAEEIFDLRSNFGSLLKVADARGTNTEGDVLTQTIDGRNLNDVWREFQAALAMWNARRDALVSALTFQVSNPIEDVPQSASEDFERASEFGVPKGIRGGDYFSMGYDFEWYDVAVRYTWKYLAEATAAQVEAQNNMALEADNRLVFRKVFESIFNSGNRTTDIRGQNYNVYPFYNGDGTVPPKWKNSAHDGTHTHYIISGAAAVVSGDLDDMETHLKHHGYGKQNGSTLVLMVASAELAVIRTFRVATGQSYDFVPVTGSPPFLLPTNTGGVAGSTPPRAWNGLPVAGQYGNWLIIEEDYMPSGYMFGFATGGDNQATNPVGIRSHQNAALRGLRLVKGRDNDYPLVDSYYNHGLGTGVRHRGAGIVMQIKAAGGYDVPADYVNRI